MGALVSTSAAKKDDFADGDYHALETVAGSSERRVTITLSDNKGDQRGNLQHKDMWEYGVLSHWFEYSHHIITTPLYESVGQTFFSY